MFYCYLNKAWRKLNAPDNDIEFNPDGYSCDFDWQLTYSLHPDLAEKGADEVKNAVSWYKDATPDLIASITAIGSVAATGGSPIKVECNSVGMMSRQ